jgi:hypothetical protein
MDKSQLKKMLTEDKALNVLILKDSLLMPAGIDCFAVSDPNAPPLSLCCSVKAYLFLLSYGRYVFDKSP